MTRGEPRRIDAVPWESPVVRVVLLSTLLAPLGVPLISPALPVVRDVFSVTDARASLLISAYFAVGIVLSPFIGIVADRVGRRRVLVTSLLVFGLTGGAQALAPTFDALLGLRAVQGTAAAGIFITTVTLVGDAFEGVRRNAVLGVNTAVLSIGAAIFPLVGGALVAVSWNAPFLAYLLAVPVGLFALRTLEDPVRPEDRPARSVAYLREAAGVIVDTGAAGFYLLTFAIELLLFGAIFTALSFMLRDGYGLVPLFVGAIITAAEASSTVAAAANGRLARRVSNTGLVTIGFAFVGVGLAGAWAAPSALLVGVAVLAVGAGLGLVLPSVDAELSGRVPTEYRAGALSLRNSATFLGRATGPILFAALAVDTGYPALLLTAGVAALALAAVAVLFGWVRPADLAEEAVR